MASRKETSRELQRRTLAQTGAPALNARQQRALTALLSSGSVSEAARRCSLSRRTLVRFKSDPAFRAAYSAASRAQLQEAWSELRAGAIEAVAVLRAALRDPSKRERTRAAVAMLGLLQRNEAPTHDGHRKDAPLTYTRPVVIIDGTEEEYIKALRRVRWEDHDFDADDPPQEIAAWRAENQLPDTSDSAGATTNGSLAVR